MDNFLPSSREVDERWKRDGNYVMNIWREGGWMEGREGGRMGRREGRINGIEEIREIDRRQMIRRS